MLLMRSFADENHLLHLDTMDVPGTIVDVYLPIWIWKIFHAHRGNITRAERRRFEQRIHVPLPELQDRFDLLKILVAKNPHKLTDANLKDLASKTRGCSCHDIKMVIKDAFRRGTNKVRTASHFRKVSAPSHRGPNVSNRNMWEPCSPDDPQAEKKSWRDLDEDETAIPPLTEVCVCMIVWREVMFVYLLVVLPGYPASDN
ncbi:hypothetical protein WR25_17247 [Diploscapter pachys]|uniref:Spastin/Vps4 C-terminal domain-containing protein n=1 Tax=Diploscapter pachys TaxID=2018661 RepID=A0A2A2LVG9_9BILA|nr:hypothetical protein WR25_17247 [Diploscapter pachys]